MRASRAAKARPGVTQSSSMFLACSRLLYSWISCQVAINASLLVSAASFNLANWNWKVSPTCMTFQLFPDVPECRSDTRVAKFTRPDSHLRILDLAKHLWHLGLMISLQEVDLVHKTSARYASLMSFLRSKMLLSASDLLRASCSCCRLKMDSLSSKFACSVSIWCFWWVISWTN